MDETIWSGTDFPYACLVDGKRTLAFEKAIKETVKDGDIVVDIGSGSGILSFFAAAAGAKKVYAVEIDHLLVESLRSSIKQNDLEATIEVVEGNAMEISLPKEVNVVIAEIIETGLLDEMQLKVINELRSKGVIGSATKVIPSAYETYIRLMEIDNSFYGFKIAAPIHDWPYYSSHDNGWFQIKKKYLSEPQPLGLFDFSAGLVDPLIKHTLQFDIQTGETANAVEISGLAHLSPNVSLGATNAFNGNKILPLTGAAGPKSVKLDVLYEMGEGLGNLKLSMQ